MKYDDLPKFDYDDVIAREPTAFLAECRRASPLFRLTSDEPHKNVLMVVAPEDVMAVIADPETFSSTDNPRSWRFDSDYDAESARIFAENGLSLKNIAVWSDGAYHARVRKLIQTAFSLSQVNAKEKFIQAMVDELIDGISKDDVVDIEFIEEYTNRLTTMVIVREFGLDPVDAKLVREVTDKVSVMTDTLSPEDSVAAAAPSIVRLQKLLLQRLGNLESLPPGSLLRQFAEARVEDEPALSQSEVLWLSTLILAAGGHTTAATMAWALYVLADRPELQERLRQDPSRVDDFVEETLRIHGPVPNQYRTAARDAVIRDVSIPKGTWLIFRTDSINFDDALFERPREFDIDRSNVRRHSTFGHGAHFCIGNLLARREITLTVASFLRRFKSIEFAVDRSEIKLLPSFDAHVLTSLPLRLRRTTPA
ncbi:MAG: cytochrome P450 [Caulobacterales bacterium]